jgi:hypothetical protein
MTAFELGSIGEDYLKRQNKSWPSIETLERPYSTTDRRMHAELRSWARPSQMSPIVLVYHNTQMI